MEAARGLVGRGAHVVLAVRDTAKGEEAAAHLDGPGSSSVVELDLSDLDQVADCAQKLLGRHDTLSALVCNAGVMGGPYRERQLDVDGVSTAVLEGGEGPPIVLLHGVGSFAPSGVSSSPSSFAGIALWLLTCRASENRSWRLASRTLLP